MLKELLHNKVYAILFIIFTMFILIWVLQKFGIYEGMTGGDAPSVTGQASPVKTFNF